MLSLNKTNLLMAVRGYKTVKKQQSLHIIDVTAIDTLNNKVLLRRIEPLVNEYINRNDVEDMAETVKRDGYYTGILISNQFTDTALDELKKQRFQYISQDHMPSFDIHELYLAIVNCANIQCQKKCGKALLDITECNEKVADFCKIKGTVSDAKHHFEEGKTGLLNNDLKMALALNH